MAAAEASSSRIDDYRDMSTPSIWQSLKRLGPFFWPYRRRWGFALASLVSAHVVEASFPLLLKEGVNRISNERFDLTIPLIGILGVATLRYAAISFGRRRNALVSVDLARDLRSEAFGHLQRQGAEFFATFSLGDLMARATNDIESIRLFFRVALQQLLAVVAVVTIAPLFMFVQSPLLTCLVLAAMSVVGALSWALAISIRKTTSAVSAQFGSLTDEASRSFSGIRTIQAHALEDSQIAHFSIGATSYAIANVETMRLRAQFDSLMTASAGVTTLLVVGVGGSQVQSGELTLGALTAFLLYSGLMLGVLKSSGNAFFALMKASAACVRLFEILDRLPEIVDSGETDENFEIKGGIVLENLTYRYPNGHLALRDISATIAPGEFIVIVGRVGDGKTTLLRLLARQLEPTGGSISLDGFDLRQISLKRLRQELTFVRQDPFLFSTSFAENISYDIPNRAEESVWTAARAAALEETIRRGAKGLQTSVGEKGLTLSGGQKQRTSLARGIIRGTSVLFLDDCFSALDTQTETRILSRIRALRQGATTIIVTHRISTARLADRIFVLERGRLAEAGTHDELRSSGCLYAEQLRQQEARPAPANGDVE
ncbi:ABC transporter ATP-binding protein [Methylosinus sp. H3A]|uniref:ABC transporter ATP-binding protein n=1 Tax=Methylosinus sp. H3A TaxID=2785786 RepID=UPI0018C2F2F8|nr:ABC transporter ATP-binding protein [Methylosinus sp. H3A]MBG0808291.1 ABC transporter ATP-binding protein [Methylosinus sp. H3A]